MNEIIEKNDIENKIYEINGVEVMLDSDLAELYQVETKRINEAVKNNPDKFPERYLVRLKETEYVALKSKISTSKGGSRKGHTAFTEQGVYMLATILKSKVATKVSIRIMDTFVKMRHYINFNEETLPYSFLLLETRVSDNTKRYKEKIVIVSKNINEILKKKYEKQYSNVAFIRNDSFHDRFIIIDRAILYTCGASLKDLGKKCFSINRFDDIEYLNKLLDVLKLCYN